MKLRRFRVCDFRSVKDSGWIDASDVTTLIGVNESGKTNLLLPLWKLNPANDGAIDPISDYPRAKYGTFKAAEPKPVFIYACFEPSSALRATLVAQSGHEPTEFDLIEVTRDYAGKRDVSFPNVKVVRTEQKAMVLDILSKADRDIRAGGALADEAELVAEMVRTLNGAAAACSAVTSDDIYSDDLKKARAALDVVKLDGASPTSTVVPRFRQVMSALDTSIANVSIPHPDERAELKKIVLDALPKFVYYHQYGNLDSEIYLPHVIANMQRADLGQHEAAKARTLRVLFNFVKLSAEQIRELGKDIANPNAQQIKEVADRKREREILLQSAGSELTTRFREWWKQGQYRFHFQADGDHFRIWVSDDVRPDPIELEGRSTGLQWFLSFYLVFLVESGGAHAGAILLLDEPGVTLHPLSQKELSHFFDHLSQTNQLVYTTHSPFLVDSDHLDRVKAVYVNGNGHTAVSADLRAGQPKDENFRSVYSVHAALGLSASEAMLQGCQSSIVEGSSDQIYLSAIKNALIAREKINPQREMIFLPAGGVKGVRAAATTVTAKDEDNPIVILDGDKAGRELAKALGEDLYAGATDRILDMSTVLGFADAEIEDLWPKKFWADIVTKYLRGPEEDFNDFCAKDKRPIVPQVEAYAKKHGLKLEKGWKVEIARSVKVRFLRDPLIVSADSFEEKAWCALFDRLLGLTPATAAAPAVGSRK